MWNKISVKVKAGLFLACIYPCLGSPALSYGSEEWSLEVKAKRSDVVVVGKVTSLHVHDSGTGFEIKTADVAIKSVLKGVPRKIIEVLYRGPISEENPDCCVVGKSYVFFLRRAHRGVFEVVNSGYGIYPAS